MHSDIHGLLPSNGCASSRRVIRVYIAGPMSGLPELNFPAFYTEATRLRALGYEVVNPAEINPNPNTGWVDCMRADIKQLVDCDTVALLPDWAKSRGARLEHSIAEALSIACFPSCDFSARAIPIKTIDGGSKGEA